MNRYSTYLLAVGILLALALASPAAEPKLEPYYSPHPALQGFLGVPGAGDFIVGGVIWHRSGQIFGLEQHPHGLHPLSIWKADPKTLRATRTATFQVGEAWCVSQKGDLLCAQSPRKEDEPEFDPATDQRAWQAGAFGCFQLQGGSRMWSMPVRENEKIAGAAFTLDDKMVAVLSVWSGQMSLRLLDATNGLLVRQHVFPVREPAQDFKSTLLMMRADEVWLQHRRDDANTLLRFPLATLTPVKFECPPLDELTASLKISPDGRHILCRGNGQVICLGLSAGKWQSVYEDQDISGWQLNAEFTPDGKNIVIVTADSARVTDLATKKTQRIKLDDNSGGTLSPDGGQLLVEYENGFEIISLRETDATNPARQRQHVRPPQLLRFSKNGKTLFATDAEGVWVWDLATRKPRAWLKSQDTHERVESTFDTLSLIADETEVISEEHDDFLRWKLPPQTDLPPAIPVIVKPELAFGGVRVIATGQRPYAGVFAHPEGKWLVSVNSRNATTIHRGLGAGIARSAKAEHYAISSEHWFFGPDDSFTFHDPLSAWYRLDLLQGRFLKLPSMRYEPIAVLPRRQFVISEDNRRVWASSLDGKTKLPDFEMPKRDFSPVLNVTASVSADEKRCAWLLTDYLNGRHHVFVWEIETGRLIGQTLLPTSDSASVGLSPDGAVVAVGHEHTAISLWEVAKLSPLSALDVPPRAPKVTAAPRQPIKPSPSSPPPSPNVRQELRYGVELWDIRENGSVAKGASLPEAGTLRVDGTEFTSKAHRLTHPNDLKRYHSAQMKFAAETTRKPSDPRFRPIPESKFPDISAGLIQISEGAASDVWVSRQIGNPAGAYAAFLTFTDSLTYLGSQEKSAVVEFAVRFPALTKTFVDSTFKPVTIEPDGALNVSNDAIWIAALPEQGTVLVPIFMFRSASGGAAARLMWQAETHKLTVRHPINLIPGETRYLMHALRVVTLREGESPTQFDPPRATDHGLITSHTVCRRGINFGLPEDDGTNTLSGIRFKRTSWDVLGASWEKNADGSLANATTTSSAHQLCLDGAPLPFSSPGMFVFRGQSWANAEPADFYTAYGSSLDEKITVSRSINRTFDQSLPLIIDSFINQKDEPVTTRLAYVSTFSEPVAAVYDATGKPTAQVNTPQGAALLGGALIVEFAGPQRPSTALSFYQSGAVLEPKVSWPSAKLLKIEYEVTLPPKKSVEFWHGATQRNLAPFSSVAEAFTGVLPFKRKDTYQRDGLMNVK